MTHSKKLLPIALVAAFLKSLLMNNQKCLYHKRTFTFIKKPISSITSIFLIIAIPSCKHRRMPDESFIGKGFIYSILK